MRFRAKFGLIHGLIGMGILLFLLLVGWNWQALTNLSSLILLLPLALAILQWPGTWWEVHPEGLMVIYSFRRTDTIPWRKVVEISSQRKLGALQVVVQYKNDRAAWEPLTVWLAPRHPQELMEQIRQYAPHAKYDA